nr:hypothetical protein NZ312_11860 [Clostridioides difficile]
MKYKELLKKVDDIENFKELDNIKCSTDTGKYTIQNSKKGYLTKFNIQGKTLINLANPNNIYTTDGVRYNNPFKYIKSGNEYTFINICDKQIKYTYGGIGDITVPANSKVLYTIPDANINTTETMCYGHTSDGWGETDSDKQKISKAMLVLEGDYTNEDISYFEGMQSVGQGNNIELLSYQGENLFDGTYQDGYFDGNSLDEELIQGMPCITTNWIECNPNIEYYFLGGNRKQIQFKNEKNIFKSAILNSNNFETPTDCTHFRLYYARTDQFYPPLNIYKKGDIKIIPYALRSLSSEIKDRIIYKNNGYKLVQSCKEITLNGDETWGIHTSIEKTNTMVFATSKGVITSNGDTCILNSDKFKPESANILANCDYECVANGRNAGYETMIRISKTKADSLETFKTWLKSNNITVIHPLERPREIELVDLSMQAFEGKTKFLLATGSIIPKVSFESTQNLGSHIEVIRSSIANISYIQSNFRVVDLSNKLLNGWKGTVSDNDGFMISKNGNQVSFHMRITGGAITESTALLKLPDGFIPNNFYIFPIFTTQTNQLVRGFVYFNFSNGYIQITELSSNVDIYSYGTYFIE